MEWMASHRCLRRDCGTLAKPPFGTPNEKPDNYSYLSLSHHPSASVNKSVRDGQTVGMGIILLGQQALAGASFRLAQCCGTLCFPQMQPANETMVNSSFSWLTPSVQCVHNHCRTCSFYDF